MKPFMAGFTIARIDPRQPARQTRGWSRALTQNFHFSSLAAIHYTRYFAHEEGIMKRKLYLRKMFANRLARRIAEPHFTLACGGSAVMRPANV